MRQWNELQQMRWLLKGLGLYGVGGGGDPWDFGEPVVEDDLANGRSYNLVDVADVPDSATIVSGGYLGSVADPIDVRDVLRRWETDFEFGRAIHAMEDYLGKNVDYLLASELGGGNTVVMLTAGARLGLPVIDGDGAGRAVPEMQMTSLVGHGLPLTPLNMLDLDGNLVFVANESGLFGDQLGRFMVTRRHGMVASVNSPLSGADAKRTVVPGTISKAMDLGRFCSDLAGSPEEKLDALVRFVDGVPLFWGTVTSIDGDNTKGHYLARVDLAGKGRYDGSRFRIIIKNETMAGWRDEKPVCVFPDLLMMVDPDTLEGVMSANIAEGQEMILVGSACHDVLRGAMNTDVGRVAFSSERYGEAVPYSHLIDLNPA